MPMFISAPGQATVMIAPRDDCVRLVVEVLQPPAREIGVQLALSFDGQVWAWSSQLVTFYDIYRVLPSRGPVSGGTTLSIYGVNLDGAGDVGYRCRLRCSPTSASCHGVTEVVDLSMSASLVNASNNGVEMQCGVNASVLQFAGVSASAGSGLYVLEIAGPGENRNGWTASNLTVELYHDPVVDKVQPALARNDGPTTLAIFGQKFVRGMSCRFVLIGAQAPFSVSDAEAASALRRLQQGLDTSYTNSSFITCPLPPVPASALGVYKIQFSGNNHQWSDGGSSAHHIRIYGVPVVDRIFPSSGPASGVLPISVFGNAFESLPAQSCIFNGSIAAAATVVNSSLIRCSAPGAGVFRSGMYHSVQITPDGDVFSDATFSFVYYGAREVLPASGPVTGGTVITVVGPHLSGASPAGVLCKIQNPLNGDSLVIAGTLVVLLAPGQDSSVPKVQVSAVECTTPNPLPSSWLPSDASSNTLIVAVSLHGLVGLTLAADLVTFLIYRDPLVQSVHPSFSSTGGGVAVTITGSGFLNLSSVFCRFKRWTVQTGGHATAWNSLHDASLSYVNSWQTVYTTSNDTVELASGANSLGANLTVTCGAINCYCSDSGMPNTSSPGEKNCGCACRAITANCSALNCSCLTSDTPSGVVAKPITHSTLGRSCGCKCEMAARSPFVERVVAGHSLPTRARVVSDSVLVCSSSRVCLSGAGLSPSSSPATEGGTAGWPFLDSAADYEGGLCHNEGLSAVDARGSVDVSLNGQQFTNTNGSVPFVYYFASGMEPSGGPLEGGTTVTITGQHFNATSTPHYKCRFSHNMYEVAGALVSLPPEDIEGGRGEVGIVCISPQGRGFSTVQVCVASSFSATDHTTMGCAHAWTANKILFFHYTLYPLIYLRPASVPSGGEVKVAVSLVSSQYDVGYTSPQQFRSYSRAGAFCRFGGHSVAATIVNATRLLCIAPPSTLATPALHMKIDVTISLNGGQQYSLSPLPFSYHIISSISPLFRPSRCVAPECIRYTAGGAPLTCDWCSEYPQVATAAGMCNSWEDIYVKGFKVPGLSVTVRGVNLFWDSAQLAEGAVSMPRCRLGALNTFNSSSFTVHRNAAQSVQSQRDQPAIFEMVCQLPDLIYQSDGSRLAPSGVAIPMETPTLELEVSVNGRDFTSSASSRIVTGGGTVQMTCPPVAYTNLRPSIGTPKGGTRVLIQGTGFSSARSGSLAATTSLANPTISTTGSDQYKSLVKCAWGDYPFTTGEVMSDGLLACQTPAHTVPESLPLRFTLNGNVVHKFDDVRFTYTKTEWLDPSSAPSTGGTLISVLGYNLKPKAGNSSYICLFGSTR